MTTTINKKSYLALIKAFVELISDKVNAKHLYVFYVNLLFKHSDICEDSDDEQLFTNSYLNLHTIYEEAVDQFCSTSELRDFYRNKLNL